MRDETRDDDGRLLQLECDPASDRDAAEAAEAGLVLVREVLQLRRPLPLDGSDRTTDLVTRPFRRDTDADAVLDVNNRAFDWHPDQSGWTLAVLDERLAEPWVDADGFLVTEVDGRIAGFCWTKRHDASGTDPAMGEIHVIAVDPDLHGRGLGRSLTIAGLSHLHRHGLPVGMLHVEGTNDSARALYRSLGFVEHDAHRWWAAPGTPPPSAR